MNYELNEVIPINGHEQGEQGHGKGKADILPAGEGHTLGGVFIVCKCVGASEPLCDAVSESASDAEGVRGLLDDIQANEGERATKGGNYCRSGQRLGGGVSLHNLEVLKGFVIRGGLCNVGRLRVSAPWVFMIGNFQVRKG